MQREASGWHIMMGYLMLIMLSLVIAAQTAMAYGQETNTTDNSRHHPHMLLHSRTHNRPAGWGDCGSAPGQKSCHDPFLRRRHRAHGDHDGYEQPVHRNRLHQGAHETNKVVAGVR